MLAIGLTGGIGAGKSVVSDLFTQLGVPIIDADVIARQLTAPGQPALKKLRDHFGDDIFEPENNHLDRKKLRSVIFANPQERLWLENFLHPLIRQEINQQIQATTADYCLVVIPLLNDLGAYPMLDRVLLVDTTKELQMERVKNRDQMHPRDIEAIFNVQINRQTRLAQAHDVIVNDGKLEDLRPQVEKLHRFYLDLAAKS